MNPDPNLGMVERIAAALGPLRDKVVFVGGSATGLLITDPLAAAIRVTKDVGVIVEVASGPTAAQNTNRTSRHAMERT